MQREIVRLNSPIPVEMELLEDNKGVELRFYWASTAHIPNYAPDYTITLRWETWQEMVNIGERWLQIRDSRQSKSNIGE